MSVEEFGEFLTALYLDGVIGANHQCLEEALLDTAITLCGLNQVEPEVYLVLTASLRRPRKNTRAE